LATGSLNDLTGKTFFHRGSRSRVGEHAADVGLGGSWQQQLVTQRLIQQRRQSDTRPFELGAGKVGCA
jgi:hypothetical protein